VRSRLRHEIKHLQQRLGVTTIMVTHDQEEALTMADRIVVMNAGRIEQVGTPGVIYGEPATAFVADFVGTMNFLHGTTTAGGVRVGKLMLHCVHGLAGEGEDVIVAVRPEDLVLDRADGTEANGWPVTVEELEFLGSFVRATLTTLGAGPEPLSMLADVSINLVRRTGLEAGQTVDVALPSDRIRVYPATVRRA